MKRPEFPLSTITSTGPAVLEVSDGTTYTRDTPCPKCGQPIDSGDRVAKPAFRWMHQECAKQYLADIPTAAAWMALAEDAARQPRRYKAGQLREILNAVIGIAFGAELDDHAAHTEALVHGYERHLAAAEQGADAYGEPREFADRYAQGEWYTEWDDRLPVEEAWSAYVAWWLADHEKNSVRPPKVTPEDPRYRAVLDEFADRYGFRIEGKPEGTWGVSELNGEVVLGVGESVVWGLALLSPSANSLEVAARLIEDAPRPLRPLDFYAELWGDDRG